MLKKWKGDLMSSDIDYLREKSSVKGELTQHIRRAVGEYVKKMKMEAEKNGRK